MAKGSLKDRYLDDLGALYDSETQNMLTLPRLAEAARLPQLREALRTQCAEARLHLERLELIYTHWGEPKRARQCVGLSGIVQKADDRLHEHTTDAARDAAVIGVAHRIAHYELVAYGAARLYARELNRIDDVRLLDETLQEEGRVEQRLTQIAETYPLCVDAISAAARRPLSTAPFM